MTDLPGTLKANPLLSTWVGVAPDGGITLRVGKVELGQGIYGALTGIAAGALDVPAQAITVPAPSTATHPNEGLTVGSLSIQQSGAAVMTACGMVRALFVTEAARRLGVAEAEVTVRDGRMVVDGRDSGLSYGDLAEAVDLAVDAATLPLPPARDARPLARADLAERLRGRGFLHDLRLPKMLHARVLRGLDAPQTLHDTDRAAGCRLIRRGGFAAIVGDREYAVERAAARLRQPGPPPPDDLADRPARTDLFTGADSASIPNTGQRIEETYWRPHLLHGSIGPSCGVALWSGGDRPTLKVWTHSQGIFLLRHVLAQAMDLPPDRVEVVHLPGAGCYGHNGADDAAVDAAFAARDCPGQPVRLQWSRADEMLFAPVGPMMSVRIGAQLNEDGHPVSWDATVRTPTHSDRPGTGPGTGNQPLAVLETSGAPKPPTTDVPAAAGLGGLRNAAPLYDLPEVRITHEFVEAPGLRTSALRGLGAHGNVFAIEAFIDRLAAENARDPLDYRLSLLSEPRAIAVTERLAELCCWRDRGDGGAGTGIGIALSRYKNTSAWAAVAARVQVEETVRVDKLWAVVDAGRLADPDGTRNQIEGGLIQALSWCLHEELVPTPDGHRPDTWADYPILRFSDVPELDIHVVDRPDAQPLGVGEAMVGPTGAAVANAVHHAIGLHLTRLPLTRARLTDAALG